MSVYCDWVRWKVGSATTVSVWQLVKLSEQIRPLDTLACCWDVKQPTNNNNCSMEHVRVIMSPLLLLLVFSFCCCSPSSLYSPSAVAPPPLYILLLLLLPLLSIFSFCCCFCSKVDMRHIRGQMTDYSPHYLEVDQPCLVPQSTSSREMDGAAQVFHPFPLLVEVCLVQSPRLLSVLPPEGTAG